MLTHPKGGREHRKERHMTASVKLEDGTVVTGTLVSTTRNSTPVADRKYQLQENCPVSFKGKQRQIVRDILATDQKKEWTLKEVTKLAIEKGLQAVGGVEDSCRYHLHNLNLAGFVKVS